MSIITRYLS